MTSSSRGREVNVLGPLEVRGGGSNVRLRPAQRRLLSVLLLDPESVLDTDALLDRMWGDDPPATARTALHVHLSALRRVVPGLIGTTATGYHLEPDGYRFDRSTFEALGTRAAAQAQSADWDAVLRTSARAMALWRGDPFDDLRADNFAAPEINRLTELWSNLGDLHARALVATRRHEEAVLRLRALVAHEPLREPRWEQLMLALYRSGRPAEALRTYQDARRVLAEELGVEPGPALRLMAERILVQDASLGEPERDLPEYRLPPTVSSFIGREIDLQRITATLADRRVVTVVGGPGFGKTRLAVEAGRAVVEQERIAAWFVPLAEARNREEVVGAIATTVGLRRHTATLEEAADRVADLPALLILDNCEHLLEPCAEFIGRVMSTGRARLRILATSRRPLGLPDEAVLRIEPLPAPAHDMGGETPSVLASAAVRLFVDRARAADGTFRITPESAPLVAGLCRRAEGIPLALELAARWVPALSVPDIEEMLGADVLPPAAARGGPSSRRSLRAAMQWSVALLPPGDRQLFIATSVFNGSFALEDALAVCTTRGDRRRLAVAIARLVDASLLVADRRRDGSVRYRALIPIREFGRERLGSGADVEALRERFVTHYLRKARGTDQDDFRQVVDLAAMDDDLDNLHEAFELGVRARRTDEVALSAMALDVYFHNRYLAWEQRSRLAGLLPEVGDAGVRAAILRSMASLSMVVGDVDESLRIFTDAIAAFRELDDPLGLARCLVGLSGLHAHRGEWTAGEEAAREARRLLTDTENLSALAIVAYYVGENLAGGGQVEAGIAELSEAALRYEHAGDLSRASHALSTLADIAVCGEDEAVARRSAGDAMAFARQSGSTYRLVRALAACAEVEGRWGDPANAARLLLELHESLGPHDSEHVSEFLFPAAFLLRRWEAWELLLDLLRTVEDGVARLGEGYPEPWRAMARRWRSEAPARFAATTPPGPLPIDRVEEAVVRLLAPPSR